MEGLDEFEIKINDIKPHDLDISDIRELFNDAEKLLYPNGRKGKVDFISYRLDEGSAKNKFFAIAQIVIAALSSINGVASSNSLDGLDENRAIAIEKIQHWVKKTGHNVTISAPNLSEDVLNITTQTNFVRDINSWYEVDMYLYGVITDMGGQKNPNIHLSTERDGVIIISISTEEVKNIKENLVYKEVGVFASVKQNVNTHEIKKTDAMFREFVDYDPKYDADYINDLIQKGTETWKDVPDADEWLSNLRGY